jgi:hypothetical protein
MAPRVMHRAAPAARMARFPAMRGARTQFHPRVNRPAFGAGIGRRDPRVTRPAASPFGGRLDRRVAQPLSARSGVNKNPKVFAQMGPGMSKGQNAQPPKAQNTPKPQNQPKPTKTWKAKCLECYDRLPLWIRKPVDWGITRVVPVYGPVKTTTDAVRTLKPKIEQTLENSERSNELHNEAIKAAEEAIEARKEQGGGVFSPNLNQDWME